MVSETQEPPPNIDRPGALFMYDKKTTRVSTYNENVGIYKHESEGIFSYFHCKEPYPNELSKDKVLYLFSYEIAMGKDIVFVDRYGREYQRILPEEVEKATVPGASTYAPEEILRDTYTPSKSTNPFSEEYDATSHSTRQPTFNYQDQPTTHPSLQAWLRQSATLEQVRNRDGYQAARGLRDLQEPSLYSRYQGESKPKTQGSTEPGRPPIERVRRDEPSLARTGRNYGLGAPLGEEPGHYRRPEEVYRLGRGDPMMRFVDHRRIRPSQVQKWVNKKYTGNRDPRDHVAAFLRVIRAEELLDFPTQFAGFGLTLEDDAATWFDSVE
ncbi:hypothetical protein GOP47_0021589 [Adiantum capillus-veneris]|uniref:Uncharacterized protein n=1 Tax=Adiantum capillus-veneris TaxID=13818 RepID=A0A9D4U8N5_ADICA|nr:hypothetical protein GOP47_0021589 [Adiantum capillus-veneris]